MVRATAFVRRFAQGRARERGDITVEEIQQAETDLHLETQKELRQEVGLNEGKHWKIQPRSELNGTQFFIDKTAIIRFQSQNPNVGEVTYDAR